MLTNNLSRSLALSALAVCLLSGCDRTKPESTPKDLQTVNGGTGQQADSTPSAAASDAPTVAGDQDQQAGDSTTNSSAGSSQPSDESASNSTNASVQIDPTAFQKKLLEGLEYTDFDDPAELISHIQRVDVAIQDLMAASANNLLNESSFIDGGLKLGKIKLEAAKRLEKLPDASGEQRKAAQLAQLIALSHLSGFRDVESAKQLEKYAGELAQSADLDLAHQSRVVLMGFQIQALQNGIAKDPNELLSQAEALFERPEDRKFPELMILLQSNQVLTQMGFADAANRVNEILVQEYSNSTDPQLRNEAWNVQTRGSQALENYLAGFRSLGTEAFDPVAAIQGARGLFTAYPSVQTLEQLTSTITDIEYDGNIELSEQLADFIVQGLKQLPEGVSTEGIDAVLNPHNLRIGLIGKPLSLNGIVGFDEQAFSMSDYSGKVVLVDFWATWCGPCLREIPAIRKAYESLHAEGFDVISINMDEDLAAAKTFLSRQNFPWKAFRASDANALGFKSSFATELGINAIPFMLLVDRDRNVAAIHVRGEKLTPAVREMLGLPNSLIPE